MRVLIHIDNLEKWRAALTKRLPEADIVTSSDPEEHRRHADYLAVWKPPSWLFENQPGLKGIVNLGAGVDALLATPKLPENVPIVKLRDAGMAPPMADYVLYGVLHFQRDFDRYLGDESEQRWQPREIVEKSDWPVGVLGLGAIGSQVAKRLAESGFPVHGWSRSPKSLKNVTCHHGEVGLEDILKQVRTLVTLLPDTPQTRGLINAERLALLPRGATLINPGRGALVDETALLEALGNSEQEGHLRGALLDVFETEPLPEDSPLWRHPRVRLTPHMSAPTPFEAAADQVVEAIHSWEAGETLATVDRRSGY